MAKNNHETFRSFSFYRNRVTPPKKKFYSDDSGADITDKSRILPNKIPVNSRSSTVCILQLFVAMTSCFVLAVSVQRYYDLTGTLGVLDWLQFLDGVTELGLKTDCLKSSLFNWPTKQFLLVISPLAAWCATHYISCIFMSLVTEICVMYFILKSKWFSEIFSICLFWVCLILLSTQRSKQWLIYNILLSVLTCVGSIYLLLVLMFGDKIFGQKRKKKRKVRYAVREPKFAEEDSTELQQTNNQEQQYSNTKKLKLPEDLDELELAEENLCHDENICISSLSLGSCGIKNGIKHDNNGSWFGKELNDSFKDSGGNFVSSSGSTSLIRPARFYVNGLSDCAKTTANNPTSASKTPVGEFSDDEGSLFYGNNSKVEEERKIPDSSKCEERGAWRTVCNRGHIQRVILVCSLTLNIILLWIWTRS